MILYISLGPRSWHHPSIFMFTRAPPSIAKTSNSSWCPVRCQVHFQVKINGITGMNYMTMSWIGIRISDRSLSIADVLPKYCMAQEPKKNCLFVLFPVTFSILNYHCMCLERLVQFEPWFTGRKLVTGRGKVKNHACCCGTTWHHKTVWKDWSFNKVRGTISRLTWLKLHLLVLLVVVIGGA